MIRMYNEPRVVRFEARKPATTPVFVFETWVFVGKDGY